MIKKNTTLIALLFSVAILAILIGKLIVNDHERDTFLYMYGIAVTTGIFILFFVRYLFYEDPYDIAEAQLRHSPSLTTLPFVTMMVAVYNEEAHVTECIDSLLAQTYPHREVIVVNDCSTDKTAQVLEQYMGVPGVLILSLPKNVGKKKALAEAILRARGSIFVFTDSDSVLIEDAVEKVVTIFRTHPNVGGISGHSRARNANKNLLTRLQDTWYEGQFSIRKAYESVFGAVTCVSGPLAAFRREAVFNLIPAWINDHFLGSEFKFATDRTKTALVLANKYFTPRVRAKYPDSPFVTRESHEPRNWRVVYSKSARALTRVPETWKSLFRQQIRWKKSFLRNLFLTGAFYWRKPFPAAAMYYLRCVLVLIGPFVVFRHLIWLPLHGNTYSAFLYLSGVLFVGSLFAVAHRIERPDETGWTYRPLMNFLSTFVLSWLIFYSIITIKKMTWHRG
jgi:cellulose synthase/poly-beta-1,6-N-acetylglucosamine synthase-like glycosyltransferase